MKSYPSLIIVFLVGALLVSLGWGAAIYTRLAIFGFIFIIMMVAVVWTQLENRTQADQRVEVSKDQKK